MIYRPSSSAKSGEDAYSVRSGRPSCSRSVERTIDKVKNKGRSNIIPSLNTFRGGLFCVLFSDLLIKQLFCVLVMKHFCFLSYK
jgi:hypothetical protein